MATIVTTSLPNATAPLIIYKATFSMTIQLINVQKHFADKSLFKGLNLQLDVGSRIGLIGRNGAGKSTLLKMIMGTETPTEGSVKRTPGMNVSYLSQEPAITKGLTLEEDMKTVFQAVHDLQAREEAIVEAMQQPDVDDEQSMALAIELGHIHEHMERLDAATMEARISKILKGLGFSLADYGRKSEDFSGGWQMRINLAKILLEEADFILLDEPTNHLDIDAIEWLEEYLTNYPGGLVLVSHDHRFLDAITTDIAELAQGKVTVWAGNYTTFQEQKALAVEQQMAAYERQQKDLEKQTTFVERFKASASRGTQAKSREKQLQKIERIERPITDTGKVMRLSFPVAQPSGKNVLTFSKLSKSFGDKHLFDGVEGELLRGERVFILGGNGVGKTTLLQLLLGKEPVDSGDVTLGHNVNIGYFSQNQLSTLDAKKSAFETMQEVYPEGDNTQIRSLLGRFLLSGDSVFKPIDVLSGGEKSKLALARMLVEGPNTLVLDEPTNHMDIPSKQVMMDAFLAYEGTMLCISHDRQLIETLATDIWELVDGKLIMYGGGYAHYKAKRAQLLAREGVSNSGPAMMKDDGDSADKKPTVNKKTVEKQIKATEKKIAKAEQTIEQLHADMAAAASDYEKANALNAQLKEQQATLEQLNQKWATLAESLQAV